MLDLLLQSCSDRRSIWITLYVPTVLINIAQLFTGLMNPFDQLVGQVIVSALFENFFILQYQFTVQSSRHHVQKLKIVS